MTQQKFKVKLLSHAGTEAAILKPPFNVVEVLQRKGRVPVNGTIDGFPPGHHYHLLSKNYR